MQNSHSAGSRQPPDAAQAAQSLQKNGFAPPKSNIVQPLPKNSEEYFGSGEVYHAFGFRSAYKHFAGTQAVSAFNS